MSRAGLVVLLAFSVEATFIPVFHEKNQPRATHAQCVTRCPVSRLVHSPGHPVSVGWLGCQVIARFIFVVFN